MKTPSTRSAFSLVEILVVVSIIGIISSFAIPAASKMIRGTDVTRAAQMVSDAFTSARQAAITRNKQIEIRFIRFGDPEQPGEKAEDPTTWKIRGIQLMEVTSSGVPVQMGPIQRLPGKMQMLDNDYSSLLNLTTSSSLPNQTPLKVSTPTANDPPIPRVVVDKARKYTYQSFRFLPDGSTNLTVTGNWFLTLLSAQDNAIVTAAGGAGATDPIKKVNYFVVQVDPVSGVSHVFRANLS